eukprot:COSAG01_NODE_54907_length_329_cov_0.517391_1_plen_69_part_01
MCGWSVFRVGATPTDSAKQTALYPRRVFRLATSSMMGRYAAVVMCCVFFVEGLAVEPPRKGKGEYYGHE